MNVFLRNFKLFIPLFQSTYETCVSDAAKLHGDLLSTVQQITASSDDSGDLSQGQMLLMGFHLLFETIDNQLDRLIDALIAAPLAQPWNRIDTANLAAEIMAPLLNKDHRQILRELLHVKKVETIISFFNIALQLTPNARKDATAGVNMISEEAEERLEQVVRNYACDCVSLLLLGLPSHLATHLLLLHSQKLGVDVTGYIEAHDVGTEGRVRLEGIVEETLESCMTQHSLDATLPAAAANNINLHLTACRKKMLFRQWESEIEGLRVMQQRVVAQHLSHQWYYFEYLKQRTTIPQLQPGRSQFLGELRTNLSNLLALQQNLAELRDKYNTLTVNVTHRLKWAAGSNPNIAQALEEFTNSVDFGVNMVGTVLRSCEEVTSLCSAVLHYEALRTNTVDALTTDSNFTTVLNKCRESCSLIERYPSSISTQEELLVNLAPLRSEVTSTWVQAAATGVSDHIEILTKQVSDDGISLQTADDDVRSSVSDLRSHLTTHHKLMSDVRALLKTMAKFEKEGGMEGIESYVSLYKKYSESMSGLVKQLLYEPLAQERVSMYASRLQCLITETEMIYDKLLEFGDKDDQDNLGNDNKSPNEGSLQVDQHRPSLTLRRQSSHLVSPSKTSSLDSKSKVKRHPLTGKVIQEHNAYALNVWKRVKVKLEGRDLDLSRIATINEQVDYTIKEAKSLDNLSTLYEGWTPWV